MFDSLTQVEFNYGFIYNIDIYHNGDIYFLVKDDMSICLNIFEKKFSAEFESKFVTYGFYEPNIVIAMRNYSTNVYKITNFFINNEETENALKLFDEGIYLVPFSIINRYLRSIFVEYKYIIKKTGLCSTPKNEEEFNYSHSKVLYIVYLTHSNEQKVSFINFEGPYIYREDHDFDNSSYYYYEDGVIKNSDMDPKWNMSCVKTIVKRPEKLKKFNLNVKKFCPSVQSSKFVKSVLSNIKNKKIVDLFLADKSMLIYLDDSIKYVKAGTKGSYQETDIQYKKPKKVDKFTPGDGYYYCMDDQYSYFEVILHEKESIVEKHKYLYDPQNDFVHIQFFDVPYFVTVNVDVNGEYLTLFIKFYSMENTFCYLLKVDIENPNNLKFKNLSFNYNTYLDINLYFHDNEDKIVTKKCVICYSRTDATFSSFITDDSCTNNSFDEVYSNKFNNAKETRLESILYMNHVFMKYKFDNSAEVLFYDHEFVLSSNSTNMSFFSFYSVYDNLYNRLIILDKIKSDEFALVDEYMTSGEIRNRFNKLGINKNIIDKFFADPYIMNSSDYIRKGKEAVEFLKELESKLQVDGSKEEVKYKDSRLKLSKSLKLCGYLANLLFCFGNNHISVWDKTTGKQIKEFEKEIHAEKVIMKFNEGENFVNIILISYSTDLCSVYEVFYDQSKKPKEMGEPILLEGNLSKDSVVFINEHGIYIKEFNYMFTRSYSNQPSRRSNPLFLIGNSVAVVKDYVVIMKEEENAVNDEVQESCFCLYLLSHKTFQLKDKICIDISSDDLNLNGEVYADPKSNNFCIDCGFDLIFIFLDAMKYCKWLNQNSTQFFIHFAPTNTEYKRKIPDIIFIYLDEDEDVDSDDLTHYYIKYLREQSRGNDDNDD